MSKDAAAQGIYLGLDFGTTNTVAALADDDGRARVIPFDVNGQMLSTFRSAMCFWEDDLDASHELRFEAGPWAIERFVQDSWDCRFIQSFKTFAASAAFRDTTIHGRSFTFEDLLSAFTDCMLLHAGDEIEDIPRHLVAGRPVQFAGSTPNDKLAIERYDKAFKALGFESITYVYEPVAAAFFFAQRLTKPATVLVADFGGGTSDFSIIHFEPNKKGLKSTALGHSGIGVAGDQFDYRIMQHALFSQLGHRARYKSIDKILEMPGFYHHQLAQWNQLAVMKTPTMMRELKEFLRYAIERDGLERFIMLIENDWGYPLYKAVSQAKTQLSIAPQAQLHFQASGLNETLELNASITRADFTQWIAPELAQIDQAVARALETAGLREADVDRVFLTGGSSFVPAVRALFDSRFGPDKVETGDQLESIAYGLALIAQTGNPQAWAA
jgi:hypothetical chaperone protein